MKSEFVKVPRDLLEMKMVEAINSEKFKKKKCKSASMKAILERWLYVHPKSFHESKGYP